MAVEAPLSKFKRNNILIYIVICVGLALWCAYDGYFNEEFQSKHTDAEGKPQAYLVFNRIAPPFFAAGAIILAVFLYAVRNKKIVAEENEIVINGKDRIPYDSIEKIDKTRFGSKGFFVITYKDKLGNEVNRKISYKTYDNLEALLDLLVAKIS